jgi:uncharacterized RDD family membrane protein YckC
MTTGEPLPEASRYGQYAGFVSRLVAFTIDALILAAVFAINLAIGELLCQTFNVGSTTLRLIHLGTAVLNFIVYVAYYMTFWTLSGQTPGKFIMGLRVVATDGSAVRPGYASRRLIAYWLSVPLFWGFLVTLIDDRRQDFPDKFARTFVIYSWPVPDDISRPRPVVDFFARSRGQDSEQSATGQRTPSA